LIAAAKERALELFEQGYVQKSQRTDITVLGKTPLEAGKLGAWLCGRSAEIALRDGRFSQESLSASAVVDFLGEAFHDLRSGVL